MAKAPTSGKDQSARYHQTNPNDTARGGLKTPVYGTGKITHHAPDYPQPGSPPNTLGHLHVGKKGK